MLTINRKDLSQALAAIKPAINRKSVLPILAYVKATYTDGTLDFVRHELGIVRGAGSDRTR